MKTAKLAGYFLIFSFLLTASTKASSDDNTIAKSLKEIYQDSGAVALISIVKQTASPNGLRAEYAGFGTGVVVPCREYNYCVLTVEHLLEHSTSTTTGIDYFAQLKNESSPKKLKIIKADRLQDFALFTFDQKDFKPKKTARFGNSRKLAGGQKVFTFGYFPLERMLIQFISVGYLHASPVAINNGLGPELIFSSIPTFPGYSGGPILNEQGELIGIATGFLQSADARGFSISIGSSIDKIRELTKPLLD